MGSRISKNHQIILRPYFITLPESLTYMPMSERDFVGRSDRLRATIDFVEEPCIIVKMVWYIDLIHASSSAERASDEMSVTPCLIMTRTVGALLRIGLL